MADKQRTKLVEQRATNAQTVAFVADQEATIVDQAEALARERPEYAGIVAREQGNRQRLQALAEEERRLATAIQFEMADEDALAGAVRQHRADLQAVARDEERLADQLLAREQEDPTVEVLVEQANRNRDLLMHVAGTEQQADRALRQQAQEGGGTGCSSDERGDWVPGTCISGAGIASGMGIGAAMAMIEEAQTPIEDSES